jgi:hypothetical protein
MAEAPVDPRQGPPLLVFVHIPKTAGTTLRTVLSMNHPGPRSRALGNVFKGGGGLSRALIERLRRGRGPDLSGVQLVRGHFPLGIREYLPRYVSGERELRCFTFLREPAERTLSHYFAIHDVGRGYGLPPLAPEATLDDAIGGGYLHDNLHTRMLSGLPDPFGEVDDAMLAHAKHNLRDGLAFFGLTERFDESLVLAKQRLGLQRILYDSKSRVNTTRPRGDEVTAELRRSSERWNHYDIELYRYAQELFDSAPERGQAEFEIELAALRAAKADGEIGLDVPAPAGFEGDEQAWRMLLHAKANLLRLELERARRRIPRVPATVQHEALQNEVKVARSRTRKLEQQVRRLKSEASEMNTELEQQVEQLEARASRVEELEQQVERLEARAAKVEELEQHVERLDTRASRADELEGEVERLKLAASRAETVEQELEQTVELLAAIRSRKNKLEQKIERLRATAPARRSQPAKAGPQRDSQRGGPSRGDDL